MDGVPLETFGPLSSNGRSDGISPRPGNLVLEHMVSL